MHENEPKKKVGICVICIYSTFRKKFNITWGECRRILALNPTGLVPHDLPWTYCSFQISLASPIHTQGPKGVARVELFVIARGSASGVKAAAHVGNLSPLGV